MSDHPAEIPKPAYLKPRKAAERICDKSLWAARTVGKSAKLCKAEKDAGYQNSTGEHEPRSERPDRFVEQLWQTKNALTN